MLVLFCLLLGFLLCVGPDTPSSPEPHSEPAPTPSYIIKLQNERVGAGRDVCTLPTSNRDQQKQSHLVSGNRPLVWVSATQYPFISDSISKSHMSPNCTFSSPFLPG